MLSWHITSGAIARDFVMELESGSIIGKQRSVITKEGGRLLPGSAQGMMKNRHRDSSPSRMNTGRARGQYRHSPRSVTWSGNVTTINVQGMQKMLRLKPGIYRYRVAVNGATPSYWQKFRIVNLDPHIFTRK
jgi:hypothetical protein